MSSDIQRSFGRAKSATLPKHCRGCQFLFTCHGECPKNRVLATPDGEPGLNRLCAGLRAFFAHLDRPMRIMADLLRRGQYNDGIMKVLAQQEGQPVPKEEKTGRNDPCPCGSGRKDKNCHGR